MACRWSGVRVSLAPLNFSSHTNSFQTSFSNNITFVTNVFNISSAARQTVDNTLGNMVNSKQIKRPKKGVYTLNPKDIQKLSVPDHYSENTIGKSINASNTNPSGFLTYHDI